MEIIRKPKLMGMKWAYSVKRVILCGINNLKEKKKKEAWIGRQMEDPEM